MNIITLIFLWEGGGGLKKCLFEFGQQFINSKINWRKLFVEEELKK